MAELIEVGAVDLHLEWPVIEEYFAKAIFAEDVDAEIRHIHALAVSGLNKIWKLKTEDKIFGYALTSAYINKAGKRVGQINLITAEGLKDIMQVLDLYETWARKQGLELIEVVGRLGWNRVLKQQGYQHNYTSYIKEVYQELH